MKNFKYKNWLCEWDAENQQYNLYTPSELEQPKSFRDVEMECQTIEQCKEFIKNY